MGASATTFREFGVFGDEIYTSTDLNRRSGEVLDHASIRPVTISRNNERFALLRREQAAKLFQTVNGLDKVVELLSEAKEAIAGAQPTPGFSWLRIYDKEHLGKLCSEVLNETRSAFLGQATWDDIEAVIHEWRESALVAQSGVLDQAMFHELTDETPLPHPNEIAKYDLVEETTECPSKI